MKAVAARMRRSRPLLCVCWLLAFPALTARAQETQSATDIWPQFRGPGGSGVASTTNPPPTTFGPTTNVLWKTALPSGHSSPAIWGNRIFLTAFDAERKMLEVLGLDRATGRILWRRDVPAEKHETTHAVSSPATATPAVDGDGLYVYFASYGVVAYDLEGQRRWAVPMPVPNAPFGSGTSMVIAGDLVILNRQVPNDPFIGAFNRKTGAVVWRQTYEIPPGGVVRYGSHSTPLITRDQVVVHGPRQTVAFDLATGERRWWVNVASSGTSSPAGAEGVVFIAIWSPFGEADQRTDIPAFDAAVQASDKNGDGKLSREELPASVLLYTRPETRDISGATLSMAGFFNTLDTNKDGSLDRSEWENALAIVKRMTVDHGLLAVKTDGSGDVTATHVLWAERASIPEVPSPLVHRNRVYMVRNGGILSCLDAGSGKVLYRGRVGAAGPYFASPVLAGDKLFLASGDGVVSVVSTAPDFKVLATNDLQQPIFASPAFADGAIYVRAASTLWAFGSR